MKVKKAQSGMVYPVFKEEVPKRKYGTLEIKDEEQRLKAHGVFSTLLNLPSNRGGLLSFDPYDVCLIRSKMIRQLAELLLGEDFDCGILC